MCFAGMIAMPRQRVRPWKRGGCKYGVKSQRNIPVRSRRFMPLGHDADKLREIILEAFDMSLGRLAKLGGKIFRIGHLGHFNDLMLAGTLSGIEMGLKLAKVPYKAGGINAALERLTASYQRAANQSQVAEEALR